MAIEWQAGYETGITVLDEDHRRLVGLINDLDSALTGGSPTDPIRMGMIIDALVDYTRYHFTREEGLMASAGYVAREDHGRAHAAFARFLTDMAGAWFLTPDRRSAERLRDLLGEWLIEHILVEDMKYVPALRGNHGGGHQTFRKKA